MNKLKVIGSCESCCKKNVCSIKESREYVLELVLKSIFNSNELLEFSNSCKEWDNGIRERGGLL